MLRWTQMIKPLGTENWISGTTPGIRLDNEGIGGLTIQLYGRGAATPAVKTILSSVPAIIIDVGGQEDFHVSAFALYYYNYIIRGAKPYDFANPADKSRTLNLYLPFELVGGEKARDTLLDIRASGAGVVTANVRFQLTTAANVTAAASRVRIFQHYYILGDHTRSMGARRQMRERTIALVADQQWNLELDRGSNYDDLASMTIFGLAADDDMLVNAGLKSITLTASEDGTKDIFSFPEGQFSNFCTIPRRAMPIEPDSSGLSVSDAGNPAAGSQTNPFANIFYYPFCRDDGRGNERSVTGLLDGSSFSNLVLSGSAAEAGTLHVLLDRINTVEPEYGSGGGGGGVKRAAAL